LLRLPRSGRKEAVEAAFGGLSIVRPSGVFSELPDPFVFTQFRTQNRCTLLLELL